MSSFRLIDAEVAAERLLERQARTDDLTGLLNRREALGRIDRLTSGEHRRGQREALLFCDLDRFKGINDHYGHAAGDLVLCAVAERIRGFLRAEDLAARVGGDALIARADAAMYEAKQEGRNRVIPIAAPAV